MIDLIKRHPEWTYAPLGEVCSVSGGTAAPQDKAAFADGGIPFVRMKDVGRLHHSANLVEIADRLDPAYCAQRNLRIIPAGSILLPRSGSVALNHRVVLGVDAVVVSHLCILQVDESLVLNQFLYRYLCRLDMAKLTKKTTGLDSIAFSDLKRIAVPLPPLAEQAALVRSLSTAEAILEAQRRSLSELRGLRRTIFVEMFGEPTAGSQRYPLRALGDLGDVVTGNTPSRANEDHYGDGIEWIKSNNLSGEGIHPSIAEERLSELGQQKARTAPPASSLVTCIAGSPTSIGNVKMLDREAAFNQQINAFIPRELDPHYAFGVLLAGKALVQEKSTGGMKGLVSKSRFCSILVPVAPQSEQVEYARRLELLEEAIAAAQMCERLGEELFASIAGDSFDPASIVSAHAVAAR